jgi:hypothetical protein
MSWVQFGLFLIVLATGVGFLVGIGGELNAIKLELSKRREGSDPLVATLRTCLEANAKEVARTRRRLGPVLELQRSHLAAIAESLKVLTETLHNVEAVAERVKLVRDRVESLDEAEQSRRAWEERRQKEHESWESAARAEADKLGRDRKL